MRRSRVGRSRRVLRSSWFEHLFLVEANSKRRKFGLDRYCLRTAETYSSAIKRRKESFFRAAWKSGADEFGMDTWDVIYSRI